MRIKSYFVNSVAAGIAQARVEMGDDAVMIVARNTPPESASFGKYEVVFGLHTPGSAGIPEPVGQAKPRPEPGSGSRLHRTAAHRWSNGPTLFVGPAGSGKTLSLMKIAVKYGLAAQRNVRIVTLDADRIAAGATLKAFGGILDVRVDLVRDPSYLETAIRRSMPDEMVLIDTPGFGVNDEEQAGDLAHRLKQCEPCEVHLVLSASFDPSYMQACFRRFKVFDPQYLLFTRVEELESVELLEEVSLHLDLPLSVFGVGRKVPDDIKEPGSAPWYMEADEPKVLAATAS